MSAICLSRTTSTSRHTNNNTSNKRWRLSHAVLASAALAALSSGFAAAAELSWDGEGQLPVSGGAGQWDSSSARWFDGTSLVAWNNGANDTAVFSTNGVSLQATEAITFGGLKFDTSMQMVLGVGGSFNWGGTALTLDTAAGTNTQLFSTIGGGNSGQTITKTGTGTFRFYNGIGAVGTVDLQAGVLAFAGASGDLSNATRLNIGAAGTFDMGFVNDTFGSISGSGTILMSTFQGLGIVTGPVLNVGIDNTSSTFSGNILGSGGRFTKSGTGNLTLSGVNTFSGPISITGGTLTLSGGSAVADTAFVGMTAATDLRLVLLNNETVGSIGSNAGAGATVPIIDLGANTLTIGTDNMASSQFGGIITGSGTLVKVGTGQQQLNQTANLSTFTGGVVLRGGLLMSVGDRKFGTVPASPTVNITMDGGTLGNANSLNLVIDANRLIDITANNGTFAVFNNSTTTRVINYGGVVSGVGKLIKDGPGTLVFTEQSGTLLTSNTYSGGTDINDGQVTSQLATTGTAGTPLGTGSVSMSYGRLSFLPTAGTNDVLLAVATDANRTFTYGPGSEMTLGKNGNNSNQLTIGPTGASSSSLVRATNGSLVLTPTNGISQLGLTTAGLRLLVNGGVANANGGTPASNGDMVSGSIISKTAIDDNTGEFLRYDATDGFKQALYSTATDINLATANDVFDTGPASNRTIATTANVYAINVRNGNTVDGPGALNVAGGAVILNGASLNNGTVAFGSNHGVIYAGGPGSGENDNNMSADITGTAGIAKVGNGRLILNFNGTLGYTGPTNISNGALRTTVSNQLPASTVVTIGNVGTLELNGTSQTVANIHGGAAFVSGIDLGDNGKLTIGSGDSKFMGNISGSGTSTLEKNGAGVLTLGYPASNANLTSGTNTFNKLVLRNGAELNFSSDRSLGATPAASGDLTLPGLQDQITLDGGTLRWTGVSVGATIPSSAAAQSISNNRGIVIGPGGGTISVTEPFEILIYQRANNETDARNLITSADPNNPGTITKTGAGFFRLGIGNQYAGKWVVKEGNLQLQTDSALGVLAGFLPDAITLDGGMIQSNGTGSLSPNRGMMITANGGQIQGFTLNAPVTGPGVLQKVGTSSTGIAVASPTWTGGILLSNGTINLNATDAGGTGTIVVDTTNFVKVLGKNADVDSSLNNPITINEGGYFDVRVASGVGVLTLGGKISGSADWGKGVATASAGTLNLSSNTSDFTGDFTVGAGVAIVSGTQALGSAAGATVVNLDAALAVQGGITYANPEPIYIAGTGVGNSGALFNISGNNTLPGTVTATRDSLIKVNADSLTVGDVRGASVVTVETSSTFAARSIRTSGLNVNAGFTQITAKGTPNDPIGTSVVGSLTIAGGPATPTAKLDLTNNSMIIDYTGAVGTLVDDTRQLLLAGVTSAGSVGLVSSAADATKGLGYGDNAILAKTSFAGQTVDADSLLIKYTYFGDTNLDGQVDITDLGNLATAWQTNGSWINGDSDYSGFIDITDLGKLATNWQAGVGSPLGPSFNDALAAVGGLGGAAVPEPTSLALLGLGAAGLLARRRRSN